MINLQQVKQFLTFESAKEWPCPGILSASRRQTPWGDAGQHSTTAPSQMGCWKLATEIVDFPMTRPHGFSGIFHCHVWWNQRVEIRRTLCVVVMQDIVRLKQSLSWRPCFLHRVPGDTSTAGSIHRPRTRGFLRGTRSMICGISLSETNCIEANKHMGRSSQIME